MAVTTQLLRHINAMRILRLLRLGPALSRAQIARRLGLTRATVGNAMTALFDSDLVHEQESGPTSAKVGRPGTDVALNPAGAYAFGIEIGTKELKAIALDLGAGIVHQRSERFSGIGDPDAVVKRVAAVLDDMRATSGIAADRIVGTGVAIPGLVDKDGTVVHAPLLGWRNHAFRSALAGRLPDDWQVQVHNDATCFARAELVRVADAQKGDLLLVLLNEGIGGAVVHDGQVLTGGHGYAGEIGHMILTSEGRTDTFERFAGSSGFEGVFSDELSVSSAAARLLARSDEPAIRALLAQWADVLAVGLANAVHLIDPREVVLGGALAQLYPLVAGRAERLLDDYLMFGFLRPQIRVSTLGDTGAAMGAAIGVLDTLFDLPSLAHGEDSLPSG